MYVLKSVGAVGFLAASVAGLLYSPREGPAGNLDKVQQPVAGQVFQAPLPPPQQAPPVGYACYIFGGSIPLNAVPTNPPYFYGQGTVGLYDVKCTVTPRSHSPWRVLPDLTGTEVPADATGPAYWQVTVEVSGLEVGAGNGANGVSSFIEGKAAVSLPGNKTWRPVSFFVR